MTKLIAYRGDPAIKEKYLTRMRNHVASDELVRGLGWDGHKGCAIGCTLDAYDHVAYETELGIPVQLAYIEDTIFENLLNGRTLNWPSQFLEAIQPGADLSNVAALLIIWQFEDSQYGLFNLPEIKEDKELQLVCSDLVTLYKRQISNDIPTQLEWNLIYRRAGVRAGVREEGQSYEILASKLLQLLRDAPIIK